MQQYREPVVGEVVLIKREKVKCREWKLGKIIYVKRSERLDNRIRECTLRTLSKGGRISILKHSPTFLVPLEIIQSQPNRTAKRNTVNPTRQSKRLRAASQTK